MKSIDFKIKKVTYKALAKALSDLGFKDKSNKKNSLCSQKQGFKSIITSEQKTAILDKTPLAATALTLKDRNILKKTNVLEELIQQNRMLKQEVVA